MPIRVHRAGRSVRMGSPQVYRGLIDYAAGLAEAQGRVRVAHVHVTRALVAELLENDELQGAIARRVRAQLDD